MNIRYLYVAILLQMGLPAVFAADVCSKVGEYQTAQLICPAGQTIQSIAFASYGTPVGSCSGSLSVSSCNSISSARIVQAACLGQASCQVKASNDLFGDPCSGVSKSLAVQATCGVPDPNWVRCSPEYGNCNFTGARNVRYGANGQYVVKYAVTGPVTCSNSAFGADPAVGSAKNCDYSISVAATSCSQASEYQLAQLSCPAGQTIQSIKFASYGTPAGSCSAGNLAIATSCNSSVSVSAVEAECLGKSSCQVKASNDVFGDPCSGWSKSLAAQAVCGTPLPNPPVSTDPNWVRCANEYGICNFTGARNVRFGANGHYITKTAVTGPITCSIGAFGGDPAVGAPKACDDSAAVATSALGTIQPLPTTTAPLPTYLASGSTLALNCGTTYFGSLNLNYQSGITITTANVSATCGRAVITPAVPVSGWTQYSGNIYVANVAQEVSQVFVDGKLISIAHYPNTVDESTWIAPTSVTANSITVSGLPNNDIIGAKATYRGSWQWAIGSRTVTNFDGRTLTLPPNTNSDLIAEDSDLGKFYLEGKLWMLDSPGEWAWKNGQLYLWMPDGSAPGGRVLAAPNVNVIDAAFTGNITVDNVRIFGGSIGINGDSAQSLQVKNTEVSNSNWSGIYGKGSVSMSIRNSDVINSLHTGFYGRSSVSYLTIDNSRFININMVGMHKGSDGAIFTNSISPVITNNTIVNCGKTGIFVGDSSDGLIKGNTVDGACLIHGDCGGIYTFDREQVPLNTRIEGNKISHVTGPSMRGFGPERYAIYLDDYSTGVTVIGNTVTDSASGLLLHGAFNNAITGNTFSGNAERHVGLSESGTTAGGMIDNVFTTNTFVGPVIAYDFSSGVTIKAATFSGNVYQNYGTSPISNVQGGP